MEFLTANTKSLLDSGHKNGSFISAKDKDVVVIGGGDTGTDCVGTSLRHGCQSVIQLEILPKPPETRPRGQSLAPMAAHLPHGLRPGRSRRRFTAPTRAATSSPRSASSATNRATSKACAPCVVEWKKDDQGRFTPGERARAPNKPCRPNWSCWPWASSGPEDTLLDQLEVERDPRSNVKAEHGKFTTNVHGVFAAGDMRRGQSLVVWAINEGRGAARECDRYLMGQTNLP